MGEAEQQRYFGVGIVRGDPREAMVRAAELAAAMVRHFAVGTVLATDYNPLPFLVAADRHSARLANGDTLHMFVLPWPAPIAVPAGTLAAFAASTRRWVRGARPLEDGLDTYVDAFVRQRAWPPVTIERHAFTEPGIHFLSVMLVKQAEAAS